MSLGLTASIAAGALVAAGSASAAAGAAAPPANIPIGALPAACAQAGTGRICVDAVVAALDAARADIGLGPYVLPSGFDSLDATKQIFVLSNLDRIAYGLPPITGLSAALASPSRDGMRSDADPDPTSLLAPLSTYAWTSNWAGNWANAPYAYYEWMYDDGYGGTETSNIDCTSPTAAGCWDHRRNVLAFAGPGTLSMGASVGNDLHGNPSFATTLVWTPVQHWTTYSYTWAQARAAGAGSAHSGRVRTLRHPRGSRRTRIQH